MPAETAFALSQVASGADESPGVAGDAPRRRFGGTGGPRGGGVPVPPSRRSGSGDPGAPAGDSRRSSVHVFAFVAGLVLIAVNWGGLIATFVIPRGHSFFQRTSSAVIFSVYRAFVWATHMVSDFEAKDGLLAAAGAIALIVQLIAFLATFLFGFALALIPWSHSFTVALRQSASSLFIIGLAHVEANTNEFIVVAAAVSGAIAIAMQIGYLPVIYQSFAQRETLVTLMESRAGIPAWGPEVLIRHELVATLDALPGFYRDWELWSADLAESHGTYPVLNLFRSPKAGDSWLLSLLAVMDAAAIQLSLDPESAPSEARLCLRMGFTALRRVAQTLRWPYDSDPKPEDPIELSYDEFAQAVSQLEDVGFPVERSVEDAWPQFRGWRVNYEALAYRFADFLMAPHAPWSGTRRHLPESVVPPQRPPHRTPGGGVVEQDRFRRRS